MTCNISNDKLVDWTIQVKHVDELYKHLYDNKENGGEILMDPKKRVSTNSITTDIGEKNSVNTPDSILNWHSHPISCYKQEKTIWGWSSGEDMRESIIYGLRGSVCHFIPSVEGLYTIQVNPCVITSLLNIENTVNKSNYPNINTRKWNWGDFVRGFVILAIEIYFRSSHVFRTYEYLRKNKNIVPSDYIDFSNSFKLENLFDKNEINGCKNIKCNQISTFEKDKMNNITFKKYTENYESGKDTSIYLITKYGNNTVTNVKFVDILNKGGLQLLQDIKLGEICNVPQKKMHVGNIFNVQLFPNLVKYNGTIKKYIDMNFDERVKFINEPHKNGDIFLDKNTKIKIKMFEIAGNCNHINLQSNIQSYGNVGKKSYGSIKRKRSRKKSLKKSLKRNIGTKKNSLIIIGSDLCNFCVNADEKAISMKKIHKFEYVPKKYPTIEKAIKEASKITGSNITSIPVYIVNGKVVREIDYTRF